MFASTASLPARTGTYYRVVKLTDTVLGTVKPVASFRVPVGDTPEIKALKSDALLAIAASLKVRPSKLMAERMYHIANGKAY